jgi:hypothetical protein
MVFASQVFGKKIARLIALFSIMKMAGKLNLIEEKLGFIY